MSGPRAVSGAAGFWAPGAGRPVSASGLRSQMSRCAKGISIPASLKNALDQAYKEWVKKPAAILAYGAVGGAFAADHLRTIAIELQMVPVRSAVHISGGDFFKVHPMGSNEPISAIEGSILAGAETMLDNLAWWAELTKKGRMADQVAEAA